MLASGAVKDMSKEMWSTFSQECKCIHRGASQALCQGVHGLQEWATHNTRLELPSVKKRQKNMKKPEKS